MNNKIKALVAIVVVAVAGLVVVQQRSGGDVTLTLATVNNGQMKDMESLKGEFEAANPGIKINFQVMEEGDLRSSVTSDVANKAGQYDIVTIGAYEVPQWGANGWLTDLTAGLSDDAYDVGDILPPVKDALSVDGKQYAVPFYGESSILMYNKEILDAAGVKMPNNPTWQQVAAAAKKVNNADHAGICLRGKPGWGDLFAPLTTVVQTFGGTWYDMDWNAKVNAPEFVQAVTFYKDLLASAGQKDPVSYSFNECLTALKTGKVAMWYDASVAASMLEADDSPVKGKMGYAHAPIVKTKESGWLWSWNLAVPANTQNKDAAVKFIKWATSKEYHQLVGSKLGWSLVPPGARTSTYSIPEYKEAAAAYAPITLEVMSAVNPKQPGVNPQPWVGIQYVAIPEFQDVGNQVAQLVADALAGRITVKEALDKGQVIAQAAGDAQKK
jgi:sorbitol/mannitol transport system substrate-binding protein